MAIAAAGTAAIAAAPQAVLAEPTIATELATRASEWLCDSYDRAPAMVIGLAALLVLPPLALVGLLMRRAMGSPAGEPIYAGAEWKQATCATSAFLEIALGTDAPVRRTIDRPLLQIGRLVDNDIRLADSTVHRYHAIIEREDAGLVITDVSGPTGNGVRLNGEKVNRAALADGDIIELGKVKVRVVVPQQSPADVRENAETV
jgi:hypothetical protein